MGPLPPSQGFRYLLAMIDRNTKWLEVTELDDVTASTVVSGFLRTWVSRYGVPVTVVTERGSQFTGELWSTMCKKLHISHRTTTSYHQESKGMIERVHRVPPILPGDFWGSAETPNQEFLTEFQRVIGASTLLYRMTWLPASLFLFE